MNKINVVLQCVEREGENRHAGSSGSGWYAAHHRGDYVHYTANRLTLITSSYYLLPHSMPSSFSDDHRRPSVPCSVCLSDYIGSEPNPPIIRPNSITTSNSTITVQ